MGGWDKIGNGILLFDKTPISQLGKSKKKRVIKIFQGSVVSCQIVLRSSPNSAQRQLVLVFHMENNHIFLPLKLYF